MANDTVQQIKDRLSIVDVVSQYVKLERAGGSLRARCPFHAERTPSFHVSPDRGTYHCFGCGVGGDIFSFIEAIEGLDFKGALKVLAEKAGVEISYEKPEARDARDRLFELLETATIFYSSRLDDKAIKYLHDRGILDETIKNFRLGWASDGWSELTDYLKGKRFSENEILEAGLGRRNERGGISDKFRNRIMFPIADSVGRIVGYSGRIFGEKASPEAPKYLNSPETPLYHKSRVLFGFDKAKQAIRKLDFAILVEGQMDLLASHQSGWTNTIAVSGTSFTPEHTQMIKRFSSNALVALDIDEAGIKSAWKIANESFDAEMKLKVARLPAGSDPADYILKEGKEAWKMAIKNSKDIVSFFLDVFEEKFASDVNKREKFLQIINTLVLPLIKRAAIKFGPLQRDEYIREVSRRIGIAQNTILEQLSHIDIAMTPILSAREKGPPAPTLKRGVIPEPIKHAFALLVWQKSMPVQAINTQKFEADLLEAIGESRFTKLRNLPAAEIEGFRFLAADIFKSVVALDTEAANMTRGLLKSRLQAEIAALTEQMRDAEANKDQAKLDTVFESLNILRKRLAEISASV